jgi:glycosyltransferase involved in cell wall biosynthesis
LSRRSRIPQLTTLHGRLDLPGLPLVFGEYPEMPLVSISDAQRRPLPMGNWLSTIHHGLPKESLEYHPQSDGYLAFLGRICPEKRLDRAISIAQALQMPLQVAAKVDPADERYFHEEIQPLLKSPWVNFVGEIGDADKARFLGGAKALLFPIDWPEPFGLVMIEALACGTPVVACRHGSVPEVLEHGKTGFIVDNVPDAIEAVRRIDELSRATCRTVFEQRFSVEAMVNTYEVAYETLVRERRASPSPKRARGTRALRPSAA